MLITISGVPDGGKIVLPVGVTGTVTPEISDGGDIVVTVDSTQLDGLTFVPPQDANGQFVLDLAIQTVDNGNESADVVNKQVTVNVTAINDAPVNILADSYEAEEDTVLTITDLAVQDVDALMARALSLLNWLSVPAACWIWSGMTSTSPSVARAPMC